MWLKYVESEKESLKLKNRIKENNCTIRSSIQETRKEQYWNLDGDWVLEKRWTPTGGAKLC